VTTATFLSIDVTGISFGVIMLKQKLHAGRLMAAGMAALAMGAASSADAATATSNLAVTASVSAN
jgi:hypothetical protein